MSESFEDWIERKTNPKQKEKKIYTLKRTRINPISKKQKKRNESYRKKHDEYLKNHQRCEICGSSENLSIHHKMGRGSYTDKEEFFMVACMSGSFLNQKYPDSNHHHTGGCHGWIEANKKIARANGWILY